MPKLNAVYAHSTRGLTQQPREAAQVEAPMATALLRPPGASGPLVAVVYSRLTKGWVLPWPDPPCQCHTGASRESRLFALPVQMSTWCAQQPPLALLPGACVEHFILFARLPMIRLSKHPAGWILTPEDGSAPGASSSIQEVPRGGREACAHYQLCLRV